MKVKICGITDYEDARAALDCGADALGFNFFPKSPRFIQPETACAIIRRLPPFAVTVGVFVNVPEAKHVGEMAAAAGVQAVQLHGDEPPEYCRALSAWTLIKALRIGNEGLPCRLDDYAVRGFLLDARDDEQYGGTGKSFDWNLARDLGRVRPVILAGGLRPDNVGRAILAAAPYAVDVCSGVEARPGKKDEEKMKEFMKEVRHVGQLPIRS